MGEELILPSCSLCLGQSFRFLLVDQHKRLNLSQACLQKGGESTKGFGLWGLHTASCWSDLWFPVRLHFRTTRKANGDAGAWSGELLDGSAHRASLDWQQHHGNAGPEVPQMR